MRSLTGASLRHYLPTHVMVVVGVAAAVAVLAGALLVGSSVRESLRELALGRIGEADVVISSPTFFRSVLADALPASPTSVSVSTSVSSATSVSAVPSPPTASLVLAAAPLIVMPGAAVHDESKRTAGRVVLYGIDERFARFHHADGFDVGGRDALISPALASELGAKAGDSVTVRVARPSDIPLSTLQGRRELSGDRIRVTVARVLEREPLREFSLAPSQGAVLAMFVPLERLQRELELGDQVNTIIVKVAPGMSGDRATAVVDAQLARVATVEDLGLRVRPSTSVDLLVVEGRGGYLAPGAAAAIDQQARAQNQTVMPVLTYVANTIRIGDREIPYSTVSGLPDGLGGGPGSISLNEWAASDLNAAIGDQVTLDYYLWSDEEGLVTDSATFTLTGIATHMVGIGGLHTLTPEYPGITDAADIGSWDPPFPVDLKKIRPKDEEYWDRHRAEPKAFVTLADAQRLWGSRFGNVSSLRIGPYETKFAPRLEPRAAGIAIRPVRAEALAASAGTTDFGEYFLYFSFFLVVSALLLSYLFFALGLEQRTREVGVLAALGFAPAAIRRAFVREGAVLAAIGAGLGAIAAIGYGAAIMYGLRTWWIGAVGTTALSLHVSPASLVIGVLGALVAGVIALWLGVRAMSRLSPRALLTGSRTDTHHAAAAPASRRTAWVAIGFTIVGAVLLAAALADALDATAGFFAAGGAWLVAGLAATAVLLRSRASLPSAPDRFAVARLGARQTSAAPKRSVLSLALIAFASFVLVTVGAFRKDGGPADRARQSGTGGYTLMAESVAPLMHDPDAAAGRSELGLERDDPTLSGVTITRVRLRPGDEASCLTLYKPTNPRIIAPEASFIDEGRFTFSGSMADTAEERANPWRLLNRAFADEAIPAIADQTTLMYALHLKIGDDFVFTPDGHSPVRLRIVGALADSLLQSEIVIGEAAFVRLFPRNEGYRVWLVDAPTDRASTIGAYLEDRLSDYGLDVVDTQSRLASYHQVENTYLATFQALGGLGLVLGTIGLGAVLARNVLERRRELALLGAVGFMPGDIRTMVLSESLMLVGGGILIGSTSAVIAILPALRARAQALPIGELGLMLAGVIVTGIAASLFAVRMATSARVVQALKTE